MLDADTARVTCFWTGAGLPTGAATVLAVDNPGMAVDLDDVATQVALGFAGINALLCNVVSITSILVKQGPDETGPSGLFPFNVVGGSSSACVPPNVSLLCSKNTNQGGRAGRGRMYLPGLQEGNVGGSGIIDSGYLGDIQDELDSFVSDMAGASIQLVLEHGSDEPFGVPGVISSITAQARVATQRRRVRR